MIPAEPFFKRIRCVLNSKNLKEQSGAGGLGGAIVCPTVWGESDLGGNKRYYTKSVYKEKRRVKPLYTKS